MEKILIHVIIILFVARKEAISCSVNKIEGKVLMSNYK
jgi:hypothetical protein